MATTSAGRVLTLCKQFTNLNRISSATSIQQYAKSLTTCHSYVNRQKSSFISPAWHGHIGTVSLCRPLHTTVCRRGLDEFFDLPENWGANTVKSGAPWDAKQLRTKSNEDLHKLWYILLKEKNMLLTLEQESKRQRVAMPSPERLRKIERSMARLETVVKERETALRLLQTGQERPQPGGWRKDVFGRVNWYKFSEHAVPWYMNKEYKKKTFFTPPFVEPHIKLRIEKHLRARARKISLERKKMAVLKSKFPLMKVSS